MEGKGTIADYRRRLDETLESYDLTKDETLRNLVKQQTVPSSHSPFEDYIENVVESRTEKVSHFLGMLRSASTIGGGRSKTVEEQHGGWKVKQDTNEFRVMYREGPEGTPFHTLLAEGYVDGPVDVCLCISYESGLYQKWWPQMVIPPFKILLSQCLKRVGICEQLSLVRMKVPWPMSSREAVIHYLSFEYFQDGLIVILLNSISDPETIDISTHGFTKDGIPEAQDVVRIDVVGGFAIQKVSANRSYFRTIANIDIKLDFVPPALINFISRQLIGSGFKLYKKEVAAVAKGDEEFGEALKDPLYNHIRQALYSEKTYIGSPGQENANENGNRSLSIVLEDRQNETMLGSSSIVSNAEDIDEEEQNEIEEVEETDSDLNKSTNESTYKQSDDLIHEITEEITGDNEVDSAEAAIKTNEIKEDRDIEGKKKVLVRPEVEMALRTLDKAISVLREYKRIESNSENVQSDVNKRNSVNLEKVVVNETVDSLDDQMFREKEADAESSEIGTLSTSEIGSAFSLLNSNDNHKSRVIVSNTHPRETKQSKIAPASPAEEPSHTQHAVVPPRMNQKTDSKVFAKTASHQLDSNANGVKADRKLKRGHKKSKFGCLHFISRK